PFPTAHPPAARLSCMMLQSLNKTIERPVLQLRPVGPNFTCDRDTINIPIADNRSSARREAEFVRDELARLLNSKAIEKAISPRVISPLSVVHGDPTSLLSRALLHTIAEAQKNLLPPSTRLPLSPSEKGEIDK
ncbi:hypothetical protein PENTCL1PPCAC_9431, partial [Pristionchus entomophagus]